MKCLQIYRLYDNVQTIQRKEVILLSLSYEAQEARRRYYRELYQKRKQTTNGRSKLERQQEAYWLRKAAKYAEQDAKGDSSSHG